VKSISRDVVGGIEGEIDEFQEQTYAGSPSRCLASRSRRTASRTPLMN
jgi:hypothetical protein